MPDTAASDRYAELIARALGRAAAPVGAWPKRAVIVDVERQRLALLLAGKVALEFPISTAANGVGGEQGSFRTPPGWHRIHARVGAGMPSGAVFVSREATGDVWSGEVCDDDLILTRLLVLEGLEPGVNRGPGVDSLERYIYVHGTNHERELGTPVSHGCIRMANADILALFDQVETGDAVVIPAPEPSPMPHPTGHERFHYAGVAGSGMSALAQFQAMLGGTVSGSDRGFDQGDRDEARASLERLGIRVSPQDGSAIDATCGALVVSTAVEDKVPDVAAAKARGIAIVHRSEMLAHWVAHFRSIAVAGTSGKSSVVAMVFEILRGAGRDPGVITGGDLVVLQQQGLWGNAWAGGSNLLVVEADESDGSLVRYRPAIGVVLNLSRDHKTESEVAAMFAILKERTRESFIVGEEPNLANLRDGATLFGFGAQAGVRGEAVELAAAGSRFQVRGVPFELPVPGRHNVENALAAIAVAQSLGVELGDMVAPIAAYRGVARRFQSLGRAGGVEVIDDFAHNPAKIRAAIDTAHLRGGRVLAVFQPHGYGPTRFLREDLVEAFTTGLRSEDRLWMLEVFYAGGTAVRDFSAADIVREIVACGTRAEFAETREAAMRRIVAEARAGDTVVVMGARDPSLTAFARGLLGALEPSRR